MEEEKKTIRKAITKLSALHANAVKNYETWFPFKKQKNLCLTLKKNQETIFCATEYKKHIR